RFLGIRVPVTRSIVKEYGKNAEVGHAVALIDSPWHEVRLAGFLLLIEIFRRAGKAKNEASQRFVVDTYMSLIHRGNNWDLVDLVAPKILGEWLVEHPDDERLLHELSAMDGQLWHQRVAIVATWTLICHGRFAPTLTIAEKYLTQTHDLIHKATGWMLRETGKRDGMPELLSFLDRHATVMPRTMLRYAIEKLPEPMRKHYLARKVLI
ncbi:MAG: DNA alkylation repair protein, partial [Muribaculaceae bacterium]|nr:DNA alkylation repair protein [Muribaculaceae bacterium]